MSMIKTSRLGYKIKKKNEANEVISVSQVLENISVEIKKGEFVVLLGRNGSGKSTFARQLNALLMPTEGAVYINGQDTASMKELWRIRKQCGMVFQNPDNQIVGATVEEDVAFGPENLGVPSEKIGTIAQEVLEKTHMKRYAKTSPQHLSGGQKQRVAIASSLAMMPECLILDEPTAMLDPQGQREVMEILQHLNHTESMTVLLITHNMEEAILADRIFVMEQGKIVLEGSPLEVFCHYQYLEKHNLKLPAITELACRLYEKKKISRCDLWEPEELVTEILKGKNRTEKRVGTLLDSEIVKKAEKVDSKEEKADGKEEKADGKEEKTDRKEEKADGKEEKADCKTNQKFLRMEQVSYLYEKKTNREKKAVSDVSLVIGEREFIGLIGATGSGKSTLLQLMGGLLRQSSGKLFFKGQDMADKHFDRRKMHYLVGFVFQYPESQLFAETVFEEVLYGPHNQGISEEKAVEAAKEALTIMRVPEEIWVRSPFCLSGGEQRRVAIASVLSMKPELLLLDEPTAGLDPVSQRDLLCILKKLQKENGKTIVMISHNMEQMASYADRLLVMQGGHLRFDDMSQNVFRQRIELAEMGLSIPKIAQAAILLKQAGVISDDSVLTEEELLALV